MGRFNEGRVYTNTKCVGCNKCKIVCPSMGANVTAKVNDKISVAVSGRCVECGLCVSACQHHARDYRDDFEQFLDGLREGKKISAIIDPTFYVDYGEYAYEILGILKELGVNKIYDVSVGAEISLFMHAKYVKENTPKNGQCRAFIANSCAAVTTYVETLHPNFLPLLIPVQSPVACTALYVRNYLGDESELALITPCLSQTKQIHSNIDVDNIFYNVTFTNLTRYIKKEKLTAIPCVSDYSSAGLGTLISHREGFNDAISMFFEPSELFASYNGLTEDTSRALNAAAMSAEIEHPTIATISACKNGCIEGNGVRLRDIETIGIFEEYKKIRRTAYQEFNGCFNYEEIYARFSDKFKDLDLQLFERQFTDRYKQSFKVPEDAIEVIFDSMHKDTVEKKNVNCQSCGYSTCREMAVAVACGYARIQDCVHYMNDDLKYAALTDRMSGIYNQTGFIKAATNIIFDNPDKKYLLFAGNVNKLKHLNNLYGVEAGDNVLAYMAKRLSELTEGHGTCGRIGGGIFAVLMEDRKDYVDAFVSYERVDAKHLGVYFPITIRYGMCRIDSDEVNMSELLNYCTYAADKTSDRSKITYVEFTDVMLNEMKLETDITLKMRDAMNNGEFVLFLQPQYSHHTGKIVGAEALCRWIKPDGSIVSPGLFIPVFEKNGFIKNLDRYVWENAFKLVQTWEQNGESIVPISVNISRISMENDDVVDTIKAFAEKYPINKDNLHFEITESAYTSDQKRLTERVFAIKNLGFKIAMDDFGSGYSSLNSLKDIPLDILKLDMGFLRGGTNIDRGNAIIAYILSMAEKLGFQTIAEGVEEKDQADYLTLCGCDVIQGFFYARPMPIEAFKEKLKTDL